MRILFCIDAMPKGGAERVVANLSNYFASNKKNSVRILTLVNGECAYELENSVNYMSLNFTFTSNHLTKIVCAYKNVKKYIKFLKTYRPDIVISFLPTASYYSSISCHFAGVKLIISERNNPSSIYDTKIKELITKFLYSKASGFVFQTKMASHYFSKNIQKKSTIIANPINEKFFVEPYIGLRKKRIVTVGRLDVQKNQILLIEAFNVVLKKHPDYQLYIYGEGPLRMDLEKKIKKLNIEDHVFLPGVSNNIISEIYDATAFVLSSDYEGMPNALMEALALGIPSISTDCPCGGPSELIKDGFDGILIPIRNQESLASAIEKIIGDPKLAGILSYNSSKKMKKYNIKEINKKWDKYIRSIM